MTHVIMEGLSRTVIRLGAEDMTSGQNELKYKKNIDGRDRFFKAECVGN